MATYPLLQLFRGRAIRRKRLQLSAASELPSKRLSALAEVARFLADPLAYAPPVAPDRATDQTQASRKSAYSALLPKAQSWPLGGLANPEMVCVLTAQSHALNERGDDAISVMQEVVERLSAIEAEGPAISPRAKKARSEMLALAYAFVANARLARRDASDRIEELDRALSGEPGMAYLHEEHAELLMAGGNFEDAFAALDRAAALRSQAADANASLSAVSRLLIAALRANRWRGDSANRRESAASLLDRAIARADATLNEMLDIRLNASIENEREEWPDRTPEEILDRALDALLDPKRGAPLADATRQDLAKTLLWRGRAGLERSALREQNEPPAYDLTQAKIAFRKSWKLSANPEISAWSAVAERQPWRALHRLVKSAPPGKPPLEADVATALLEVADVLETQWRLVLSVPAEFLPDKAMLMQLVEGDEDGDDRVNIPAFRQAVNKRVGIDPPTVLLQRISKASPNQVDVTLDGVPIGGEVVRAGVQDWFGVAREMTETEAAVAVLARAVMRHLDRLLSADHARALGVYEFGYDAWSELLRLLLAERTPLLDKEALRRAVADVAWGRKRPVEAARNYQSEIGFWNEEPEAIKVPPQELAELREAIEVSRGQRAVEIPYAKALALEKWVDKELSQQAPPRRQRLVVSDPIVRPYAGALLRARFPDLALTPESFPPPPPPPRSSGKAPDPTLFAACYFGASTARTTPCHVMTTLHIFAQGPEGAEDAFRKRAVQLADDLRWDPKVLVWETSATLRLATSDGLEAGSRAEITPPLRLDRSQNAESDKDAARRLTTALFRARGRIFAQAFASLPAIVERATEAAELGLDLDDVRACLGETTDDDFAWALAERRPAELTLLLPPDTVPKTSVLESAMRFARELSGLPLPNLKLEEDPTLEAGEGRLRVRAVRTPPVAIDVQSDGAEFPLARLIVAYAAMLLDPATMLHHLLRAGSGTVDLLPHALNIATAPQLARALRPLLEGGFGLPDAPALVAAVCAKTVEARTSHRRVALPGTIAVGKLDKERNELAARLRAAIVPGALLRRAGGVGRTTSLWNLSEVELKKLPLDENPHAASLRLAPASLPPARAEAVLLVPNGFGRRVRETLLDALPSLCVAEVGEWPRELNRTPRGAIAVGERDEHENLAQ